MKLFKPEITIDGVALFLAVIGGIWFLAGMRMDVKKNADDIATERVVEERHQTLIDKLAESQEKQDRSIAILTTLINERTTVHMKP